VVRALTGVWGRRVARLPSTGVLLVSTDLHGNLGDYRALLAVYEAEEAAGNAPVLAFCGDLVHGPSEAWSGERFPTNLGTAYRDESVALLEAFERDSREKRVFSLLGNHEHSHVGGPVVPKFHDDEARYLEQCLGDAVPRMRDLMRAMPLVAYGRCGVVLTHGAPRATAASADEFESLSYDGYAELPFHAMLHHDVLGALLWARSASDSQARELLRTLLDTDEGFVAFGHDIVRSGYAVEGPHHICVSTSFGLVDANKRYLRLDLGGRYRSAYDLRDGVEILPLYPDLV
jgi:hypothetical protein